MKCGRLRKKQWKREKDDENLYLIHKHRKKEMKCWLTIDLLGGGNFTYNDLWNLWAEYSLRKWTAMWFNLYDSERIF